MFRLASSFDFDACEFFGNCEGEIMRWILGALVMSLLAGNIAVDHAQAKDPEIPAITQSMQQFVADKEIAGAVTLVVGPNSVKHVSVVGMADVAEETPLKRDTLFWIASMTKPITGACVLMLQDEGKLSVDDPISKHLPMMKKLKLADVTPANITIRHLMTHTSGMSELPRESAYTDPTLEIVAKRYAELPVMFEPGSQWRYSQTGINTAARIVEVVSGMTFDRFVEERICKPLGMADTTFYLSPEQHQRLTKTYRVVEGDGEKPKRLEEDTISVLSGDTAMNRNRFPAANWGLFSTADDYGQFCQMLLRDGRVGDEQLLSESAVQQMRTICTGDLKPGFTPGNGWAIGCCVIREPQGVTEAYTPGTFGHGGAHGTQVWIDPENEVAMILMVQRANFPNADASKVRQAFGEALMQAL
ncbi:serine hydrolase domain-containing protein [Rhodopirellula europaea]|jgi:CubicO group peptidase (beta-lactamase class C family)|uniref:Beta-lactamase n=1 Tax=Rhodopirellula europaea SH398 TaxID=1263868 RepID=M5SJM6_9BACT|nr:serine hydrolase domain-containing protein [Rhodopirellula europaea]EMI26414.1 beta-lactamase [Rhodopirellula europaea SH398]